MKSVRTTRVAVVATAVAAALVLAACGNSGDSGSGSSAGGDGAAQKGGTLKIVGTADIDHMAPTSVGTIMSNNLAHTTARTLISYQSSTDEKTRIVPQGDLATEASEPSADGLQYSFTIRDGAKWDAPGGARQITSEDVARGIKMMCNPTLASPRLGYFLDLVKGMSDFCAGFAKVDGTSAPAIKTYMEGNKISGIDTSDPKTVKFTLTEKAGDFIYMLSLPAAAPEPVESLDYLTDSADYRSHYIASGPYTVDVYKPDQSLTLKRNPAWDAKSDPLRKAYVDNIQLTFGITAEAAMQQLQSGDADMTYDITIPTAILQQLQAAKDPNLMPLDAGLANPWLNVNTKSNNNDGALKKLKVRQALQYAVDKAAIVQQSGGPSVATPLNGIFAPGILGYHDFNLYPTPNNAGDPAKAKQLLTEAGYPNGITLKMPYQTTDRGQDVAQTLQASFKKAGITIDLVPVSATDFYSKYMTNLQNMTDGKWDLAPSSWQPDWVGGAARSVYQPQFSYTGTHQTYNYTDYDNPKADELAKQALATSDADESAKLWAQVDETVMGDAVLIPLASPKYMLYHSKNVQNFQPYPLGSQGDWTTAWLKK